MSLIYYQLNKIFDNEEGEVLLCSTCGATIIYNPNFKQSLKDEKFVARMVEKHRQTCGKPKEKSEDIYF